MPSYFNCRRRGTGRAYGWLAATFLLLVNWLTNSTPYKAFAALLITSFFIISATHAQTYEWLTPKLAAADTIVLALHEDFHSRIDSTGNPVPVPAWVVKGHPNYKALRKFKALTPAQRVALSRILLRPFTDKQLVTMHCCEPHNLVFLIRNGRTSYLDICFGCRCLNSSRDLARLYAFDDRKWAELGQFFTRLGLDYKY